MTTRSWVHDPDATLDYTWDWTSWLTDGDSLDDATIISPDEVDVSGVHVDGARVTCRVTVVGQVRRTSVTCRVTTVEGLVDDRTIGLVVADR